MSAVPTRRQVLGWASVLGATATVGACTGSARPTGSAPPAASGGGTPSPSTPAAPLVSGSAAPDWRALAKSVTGRLVLPQDAAYLSARLLYDRRFDATSRPAAVLTAASTTDVVTAVRFAREHSLPFAVRSGGHSYGGWSSGPGLVLDMTALSKVTVDRGAGVATVGAGARLVDVYAAMAAAGVGIPAGSCPSVGVAGLALGGGVGVLTRAWGLTCDVVQSVDVVTADGIARRCDRSRAADLYWASRGGGGGSFGVVTGFTMRTRAAPSVSMFFLRWDFSSALEVLTAWQRWAPHADPRLWSTAKALVRPSAGTARVIVAGTWIGPSTDLDAQLKPFLRAVGRPPAGRSSNRAGYLDAMLTEAGCRDDGASCHLPPVGTMARESLAATSHFVGTPLPEHSLTALLQAVRAGTGLPHMVEGGVSFDAMGGATAAVAPAATAFVHRTALFDVQYTATWTAGSPTPYDAYVRGLRRTLLPAAGNTAYVNYIDPALAGWQEAYWGANHPRLREVKRTYDPDGFFTFPQAVGR